MGIKIIRDSDIKAKRIEIPNVGISRPKNDIGTAGIGFIVIPPDVRREDYIADCYRTNTVMMNGGWGYGNFENVFVDEEVMKRIQFPSSPEEKGTAVIWIRDDISQFPVIIATLRKQDEYYFLKENQFLIKREPSNSAKSVSVFFDGDTSTLQIDVIGDRESSANLNVKLTSENKSSTFNVYCDNEINVSAHNAVNVNSMQSVNIVSAKKITAKIVDEDNKERLNVLYASDNGFVYSDEYDNSIKCKDGEIEVVSNKKNGNVIIRGKKINHNDGSEPMVLGNTLKNILSDLIDAILAMTVVTPAGASSTPSNAVQFTTLKSKLSKILSQISNLD